MIPLVHHRPKNPREGKVSLSFLSLVLGLDILVSLEGGDPVNVWSSLFIWEEVDHRPFFNFTCTLGRH